METLQVFTNLIYTHNEINGWHETPLVKWTYWIWMGGIEEREMYAFLVHFIHCENYECPVSAKTIGSKPVQIWKDWKTLSPRNCKHYTICANCLYKIFRWVFLFRKIYTFYQNDLFWRDNYYELGSYQKISCYRRRWRRWRFFSPATKDKLLRKQFRSIDQSAQTARSRQCRFALRTS